MISIEPIDMHLHLMPYSPCSYLTTEDFIKEIKPLELDVVAVTDHHTIEGALELMSFNKFVVIAGVEVSTKYGDFLVFSNDLEYLKSLNYSMTPGGICIPVDFEDLKSDKDTVVIWAHPILSKHFETERHLLKEIDGFEVYNGAVMDAVYDEDCKLDASRIRRMYELGRKSNLVMTGGSDTHAPREYMKCWTEFAEPVRSQADFIRLLKEKRVRPRYNIGGLKG
jgi:predicted metal-dependent phosphoesterase TrpH